MQKLIEDEKEELVFCAICGKPPGKHGLRLSRRFLGAGSVPKWAIVHPGCDVRESKAAFRERMSKIRSSEK
jgi:hypothetical protein